MHNQGFVNRDIRPDNVLIKYEKLKDSTTKFTCKIIDLGFACKFKFDTKMSL